MGIEEQHAGIRVARLQLLRVAKVFLSSFAVVVLQTRLATHGQRDRVVRPQLDEFFRRFQVFGRPARLVVPFGQLLPAPIVRGLERDERLHLAASQRQVPSSGLDPRGPALKNHRRIVFEHRGISGGLGLVVAAHFREAFGLEVIGFQASWIECDRPVQCSNRFLIGVRSLQHSCERQPAAWVPRPQSTDFARHFHRPFRHFQPVRPHAQMTPGPVITGVDLHGDPQTLDRFLLKCGAVVGMGGVRLFGRDPKVVGQIPVVDRIERRARRPLAPK